DYTLFFRRLGKFKAETRESSELLRDMFIDPSSFDHWASGYRARLQKEASIDEERQAQMNRVNPKFVLRNYLAQAAIKQATEARDYSEIARLLELLRRPYDKQSGMERYSEAPPEWGKKITVSCSS
nr:YdiU family protein [Pyrinomonadaceae bacterium]